MGGGGGTRSRRRERGGKDRRERGGEEERIRSPCGCRSKKYLTPTPPSWLGSIFMGGGILKKPTLIVLVLFFSKTSNIVFQRYRFFFIS